MNLNINVSQGQTNNKQLNKKKTISIFVAGIGDVGSTLIEFINNLNHPLYQLNIVGYCNSKKLVWQPEENPINKEIIAENLIPYQLDELIDKLISTDTENLIFADVTGSSHVAKKYLKLLQNNIHIATSSKIANTLSQEYFDALITTSRSNNVLFEYETNVGAGLPIIATIKSLIDSGDEITKITGVVSGTMTFIFNKLQKGIAFSDIIEQAKKDGYSEPDPRDDLSGEDVARKFLILARTCGYKFERSDLEVESLIPSDLEEIELSDFFDNLPQYNNHWKNKNSKALVNNKHLRYVGTFTQNGIKIGIEEVAANSPIGALKGTDNLVQIYTQRYSSNPLIIQGPGAGKEVTAAGLLADIIKIAHNIS